MQIKKLALLSGLLLTACGYMEYKPSPSGPPAPEFAPEPMSVLGSQPDGCDGLGYYNALSHMSLDEKKREQSALHASLEGRDNICEQLELALLLSLPDSDNRNDIKADKLLAGLLDNPGNKSEQDRALASLLRGFIQERLRTLKTQNTLKGKLKQEQSTSAALEQRLRELTSQLEQLKSLERDINQQEQEISTPPKDKAVDEK